MGRSSTLRRIGEAHSHSRSAMRFHYFARRYTAFRPILITGNTHERLQYPHHSSLLPPSHWSFSHRAHSIRRANLSPSSGPRACYIIPRPLTRLRTQQHVCTQSVAQNNTTQSRLRGRQKTDLARRDHTTDQNDHSYTPHAEEGNSAMEGNHKLNATQKRVSTREKRRR